LTALTHGGSLKEFWWPYKTQMLSETTRRVQRFHFIIYRYTLADRL